MLLATILNFHFTYNMKILQMDAIKSDDECMRSVKVVWKYVPCLCVLQHVDIYIFNGF